MIISKMKMKKLLILFPALLCLIFVVSASDMADIVESSLSPSGQQGTTLSGSFTVNNTGDTTLDLAFTSSVLIKGSDTLTINTISDLNNLENGTSPQSVSFEIPIGSSQAVGVYTGEINATNSSNGHVFDTVQLDVTVTSSYSLSASPSLIFFGSAIRNSTRTATFTITNDGNGGLTGVIPSSEDIASKYNVTFDKTTPFNLNAGEESETIEVSILIPFDEETTNHSIGSIVINSNEYSQSVAEMNIDVKGGLIIADFDARVFHREGGTDGDDDLANGDEIDFGKDDNVAGPGDELELRINLENTFDGDEEINIDDITITATILEIDDEEDIDEESEEFDLEPREEKKVSLFFDIPLEVEERTYEILIEIEGQDEEDTTHIIEWNLELPINKDRTDLVIRKAELIPSTLSCDRNTRLNIEVLNIGTREEDEAKVEAVNSDIGLDFLEEGIELYAEPFEDDDEYRKSLSIKVDDDVAAGTYPITINAYISSGALWASQTADLIIQNCGTVEEEIVEEVVEEEAVTLEQTEAEPEVNVTEESIEIPVVTGKVTETKEASSGKPAITLIIIGVLSVLIGILTVIKMIPKKEEV